MKMSDSNKKSGVDISIVIPVYNSQECLETLHNRLTKMLVGENVSYEIIFVNDCSKDNSWSLLKKIAKLDDKVTAINLMNNFGQHNAIMCGLNYSSGQYVVTMDDDLQHPPEEIPKLLDKIREKGHLLVYGQYKQKQHGWFRDLCSKYVNKLLSKITGSGYTVTSFRIIKKEVVEEIKQFNQFNVMMDVLLKNAVNKKYVGPFI